MKSLYANSKLKNFNLRKYSHFPLLAYNNFKLEIREVFLNNHKNFIFGYLNKDLSSVELFLNEFYEKKVQSIILTNSNQNKVNWYCNQETFYKKQPKIYSNKDQKHLLAKQDYTDYFTNDIDKDYYHIKASNDDYVYYIDKNNKISYADIDLSAAYLAVSYTQSPIKLFHAKPDDLILFEDICRRLSLFDIIDMFKATQIYYSKKATDGSKNYISLDKSDFEMNFLNCSKIINLELFEEEIKFNSSVFEKTNQFFNRNYLLIDNNYVDVIYEYVTKGNLLEPEKMFNFSLARYQKFYKNSSTTIKEKKMLELTDIIHKLVILKYIYSSYVDNFMSNNINIFKTTDFFNNKYSDIDDNEIFNIYNSLKSYYDAKFEKIHSIELNKIFITNINLKRTGIIEYDFEIANLKNEKYNFAINYKNKLKYIEQAKNILIYYGIMQLYERNDKGENINYEMIHIVNYLKGRKNNKNRKIFNHTIEEANKTLKLLNFSEISYDEIFENPNYLKQKQLNLTEVQNINKSVELLRTKALEVNNTIIKSGFEPPLDIKSIENDKSQNFNNFLNLPILIEKNKINKKIDQIINKLTSTDFTNKSLEQSFDINNFLNEFKLPVNSKNYILSKINDIVSNKNKSTNELTALKDYIDKFVDNLENDQLDETLIVTGNELYDLSSNENYEMKDLLNDPQLDREYIDESIKKDLNFIKSDTFKLGDVVYSKKDFIEMLKTKSVEELNSLGLKSNEISISYNKFGSIIGNYNNGLNQVNLDSGDMMNIYRNNLEELNLNSKLNENNLTQRKDGYDMINLVGRLSRIFKLDSNSRKNLIKHSEKILERDEKEAYNLLSEYAIKEKYQEIRSQTSINFDSNIEKELFENILEKDVRLIEENENISANIENALQTGAFYDHPIYYELLSTNKDYIKKREEYLTKYFKHAGDNNFEAKAYKTLISDITEGLKIANDEEYSNKVIKKSLTPQAREFKELLEKYFNEGSIEEHKKKSIKLGELKNKSQNEIIGIVNDMFKEALENATESDLSKIDSVLTKAIHILKNYTNKKIFKELINDWRKVFKQKGFEKEFDKIAVN